MGGVLPPFGTDESGPRDTLVTNLLEECT